MVGDSMADLSPLTCMSGNLGDYYAQNGKHRYWLNQAWQNKAVQSYTRVERPLRKRRRVPGPGEPGR